MKKLKILLIIGISLAIGFSLFGGLNFLGFKLPNNAMTAMFFQQPYSLPSSSFQPMYVAWARFDGGLWQVPPIVVNGTAGTTLSNFQTGSFIVQNVAAPGLITLPTPVVQGINYKIGWAITTTATTVSIVSGNQSTDFMAGAVNLGATTSGTFNCNGTSHTALKMNGSTTGGLIGSLVTVSGLTGGLWNVTGPIVASGTSATPCSATP